MADLADVPVDERRAWLEQHCSDVELRRQLLEMLGSGPPLSDVITRSATLPPGLRIGPYEVVSHIGSGGMGDVYKARDTRLHRDVALKVLPLFFAGDPIRLSLLEREARMLAALNHPGIAQIHGLEESGDVRALVMELVDGATLAERLAAGAIPSDVALQIARQIVDALEAAHERGIVHRDLKPTNVKVRADGTAKLLDFGLAKAVALPSGPAASTFDGFIVGTPAYMSPEQASGKSVDRRTDIWAFGCVLYEMLAGRRAFSDESAAEVRGNVLNGEPDWRALPSGIPPAVLTCLRLCLTKDVRQRIQAIGDARILLDGGFDTAVRSVRQRWSRLAWAPLAIGLGLAIVGVTRWNARNPGPGPLPERRFTIAVPASAPFPYGSHVALSPNGQTLVYRALDRGVVRLLKRPLDELEATAIPGTDGVSGGAVFFSPDGKWIGFTIGMRLLKVPTAGGPAVAIADVPSPITGAWWGDDDRIVCGTDRRGLIRVPATGGATEVIAPPQDSRQFWYPQALSGGAILFTAAQPAPNSADLLVLDLQSRKIRTVLPHASHGRYVSTGHLIFVREKKLWAVRFDPISVQTIGDPVTIEQDVFVEAAGRIQLAVASDGSLAYVSRPAAYARRTLVWVDRKTGVEHPTGFPPHLYRNIRVSPDRRRVAVEVFEDQNEIWVGDAGGGPLSRLTNEEEGRTPEWTTDGKRIGYWSAGNIWWRAADGTGKPEVLTRNLKESVTPWGFVPGGKQLLVTEINFNRDINVLELNGTGQPRPLFETPADESNAYVSPDGRWLLYASTDTGVREAYVRPFPDVHAGRQQVSSDGATILRWRPDARELFYRNTKGAIVAVTVGAGPSLVLGKPSIALASSHADGFQVSLDGQHFLMLKDVDGDAAPPQQIVIAENWFETLKRAFSR